MVVTNKHTYSLFNLYYGIQTAIFGLQNIVENPFSQLLKIVIDFLHKKRVDYMLSVLKSDFVWKMSEMYLNKANIF